MSFISKRLRDIEAYVPGEQPKIQCIKLNTNENPYPPSSEAMRVLHAVTTDMLRKYPDAECHALRMKIAELEGLPGPEYVYVGNGSDEVLAFVFGAFFDDERPLRFADVTYSFYPVYCQLWGIPVIKIPLDGKFGVRLSDYDGDGGGIVICNPNAPTSIALEREQIRELLRSHPNEIVVVDEAYAAFGAETCAPLIEEFENLVIVRTLSKSHGLAGLRLGYCLASPERIQTVQTIKNSFNSYTIDAVAQAVALAAISDVDYTKDVIGRIIRTRSDAIEKLKALDFYVPDSKTNFLFAEHHSVPASYIFTELKKLNIFVRYFSKPERISNRLRITIGTDEEMQTLYEALKTIISRYHEVR